MWGPTQNLGPIGSAVLTFIGYKQTDTKTPRQTSKVYILNSAIQNLPDEEMEEKSNQKTIVLKR